MGRFVIKRPLSPSERLLVKRMREAETVIARLLTENMALREALAHTTWNARARLLWAKMKGRWKQKGV